MLALHGLVAEEGFREGALAPVKCLRCGEQAPPTHAFCGRCAAPLDPKVAITRERLAATLADAVLGIQAAKTRAEKVAAASVLTEMLEAVEGSEA